MDVRKNVSRLTAEERTRFVRAVKKLKENGVYDRYVEVHMVAMMEKRPDPAHGGPAFFSWHREYLRRFELHLQSVEPGTTIPYWDWTRDRSQTALPWTDDFMGGNGRRSDGKVTTGPFAGEGRWPINVMEEDMPDMPPYLTRFMAPPNSLPRTEDVAAALKVVPYDAKPWNFRSDPRKSFRAALEGGPHNQVHGWVGGNMMMGSSPNDPVFWLHHCQIDRLWARWQVLHPRERRFKPAIGAPRGHNLRDPMWPWLREPDPPTAASVLNHHRLGYSYANEANW